jgi:chemotaxis protein histidine kinase CheA
VSGLTADPALAATFAAEIEDRLASLSSGLLAIESRLGGGASEGSDTVTRPSPSQIAACFRDAHTIKGTARLIGLTGMVELAHAAEDLLGALRAGRLRMRPQHIELLLRCGDALGRMVPGAALPLDEAAVAPLAEALRAAATGAAAPVPDALPEALPEGPPALPSQRVERVSGQVRKPQAGEPAFAAPTFAPAPPVPPDLPAPAAAASTAAAPRHDPVRVEAGKVHDLLAVVGETEIEARRLERRMRDLSALATGILAATAGPAEPARLAGVVAAIEELRESAEDHAGRLSRIRDHAAGLAMVPVGQLTARFPRLVRDIAGRTGKKVSLVVEGADVELDKQVLDAVSDALGHLVVNAVDHGCDAPEARSRAGKDEQATVRVRVRGAGGSVTVEVIDDGAGVDEDAVRAAAQRAGVAVPDGPLTATALLSVLCTPALSTREEVSETSGRGVGMDAVRSAVEAVGGSLALSTSPGRGTAFSVTVPVTLGVLHCLLVRVGDERYALPMHAVVETLSLRGVEQHHIAGAPAIMRDDLPLPLLDLAAALGTTTDPQDRRGVVVVRRGDRLLGWTVDALEGEAELVVKDLGSFLTGRLPTGKKAAAIGGASIDEHGRVLCVLDLREVPMPASGGAPTQKAEEPGPRPRVLVVEDSVGVRELERAVLTSAGYDVDTAVDGLDGAARLSGRPYELVLTDIEMPGLDGFELTRRIRAAAGWEAVPIVVMTSLGSDEDRRAGLSAGANAYLLKSTFDQADLVDTIRRLIGR